MKKKILLFIIAICKLSLAIAQTGVITTIAGNGISIDMGDGGPATAAEILNPPGSGAFDKQGNYYFVERFAHKVRKINVSGIIDVYAGNGIEGYSGDGGAATLAELNNPDGIAIDDSDNMYIAEIEGCRVRKVNAKTGIITTFAGNGNATETGDGGLATAASIYGPNSLCFDKQGNLYMADADNKIRKVDIVTNIITTVAGKGGQQGFSGDGGPADSAQLFGPTGVCTDSLNNLYIADNYNDRIRKVDAVTGIITTIAGNSTGTYNGEGIPASSAQLNPFAIQFDSHGNLYIADEYNYRIQRITPSGYIYTVAGTGINGYSGDGGAADSAQIFLPDGLAFDKCDNLYFPDNGNARIRKVTFNPDCTDTTSGIANINYSPAISIFPNPTYSIITISANTTINSISITNLLGQTVYSQVYNNKQVQVNMETLPVGVYFIKVNELYVQKVVKQ
jgi:trimeric autotransporter adhesin